MRHASDSLHAWARQLTVGDARAKSVLLALCLYADHRGVAWPSLNALSLDTEQSEATVRSRLKYLDQIGVIERMPRWCDDAGRRNSDRSGRRTSDDIVLLTNATQETIDAARALRGACGAGLPENDEEPPENSSVSDSVSDCPAHQEPLPKNVRGAQEVPGGSNCVDPLNYHLNQESPNPKPLSPEEPLQASPPSGPDSPPPSVPTPTESAEGVQSPERQKRWSKFCSTYPEGVLDIERAKDEFEALTDQEQIDCLAGEELFADRCRRLRQKPGKAHVFIRKRTWVGLLAAKPATRRSLIFELVSIASDEGRALANLYRMTHVGEPVRCRNERGQECYSVPVKPSQQVMGMANVPRWSEWKFYGLELPNASRWRHFIEAATGKAMVIKYQKSRPGIYAPNPWPPRIDGTWCDTPETPSTGPPEETPEEASGELASAMGF